MSSLPAPRGAESRLLSQVEAAQTALEEALGIDEVLRIRNLADAARLCAAKARMSRDIQNRCAELRLRAERAAGKLLAKMDKSAGGRPGKRSQRATGIPAPKLRDLGISKSDSSRWQRIAAIPEKDFDGYLEDPQAREVSQAGALRLAKRLEAVRPRPRPASDAVPEGAEVYDDITALVAEGRRFKCIYVDPPWRYKNTASRGAAANHYPTLSVGEIAGLPVEQLADENCHLHLWVTVPLLFEAKAVLDGWGFRYVSQFVWIKPQLGLGNTWRVSHEVLLLGVRGKPQFKRKDVPSWIELPRGRHSAKPEEIRALIESVSDGPYVELFGRRFVPGWVVVGNQVEGVLSSAQDEAEVPEAEHHQTEPQQEPEHLRRLRLALSEKLTTALSRVMEGHQ